MQPGMRTGRLAGALYLLMMPFAFFTLYARSSVVGEDAAATARNILESQALYGAAIVTWLAAQVISIFLVVQLYRLLKSVNATNALLMLALALVGVPITCANETHPLTVLMLLQDPTLSVGNDHMLAQVTLQLRTHTQGMLISQIFWGMWLLPLGWLVFKSAFLPRWLGILLLIAGGGYLFDFFAVTVFPFASVTVTQVTFIGELLLALWLLIRGARQEGGGPGLGPPPHSSTAG